MDGHIDWLSWTLETPREPTDHSELYLLARALIKGVSHEAEKIVFDGSSIDVSLSRAPYRLCLARSDSGCRIFGDSPTKTVLYELSGRACERLRGHDSEKSIVAGLADRITRFDYAVDIRSTTTPAHFANVRSSHAFRTVSFIRSDSGETVYIGSPKSDRFCRVYRYNPPHPRADLLRVEFVFRRALARNAAQEYADTLKDGQFEARLGNTWGFTHSDWNPGDTTDERVRVPVTSQKQEDTVYWLYRQVAPAVRRLLAEGAFDLNDWLSTVFETNVL